MLIVPRTVCLCSPNALSNVSHRQKQAQKDLTDSVKLQSRDSAYNTNAKTDYAKGDSMKIMTENINSNVNQASPIKKKSASQADVSTYMYYFGVSYIEALFNKGGSSGTLNGVVYLHGSSKGTIYLPPGSFWRETGDGIAEWGLKTRLVPKAIF